MPIRWTKDLSVNIAKIDEQHKRLVALVGELEQAVAEGGGRARPGCRH